MQRCLEFLLFDRKEKRQKQDMKTAEPNVSHTGQHQPRSAARKDLALLV